MNGVLLEDRPGDQSVRPELGSAPARWQGSDPRCRVSRRNCSTVSVKRVAPIGGGAFGTSGMYVLNWIDILDATQLAIDLSLTTHKWALYTNTLTPNFSSDVSYAATNEISGTNYTAGGRTIAAGGGSPTVTESPTGTIMYDQADMTWPTATFTARGGILYADALGADNLIVAQTYGADITATAGTFTIQFAATGVLTLDITP